MALEEIGQLKLALLDATHVIENFDCKREQALNDWLQESALVNQQRDFTRVWVLACNANIVRAYFTLSGHTLDTAILSSNARKGLRGDCHVQLLGRFAVDRSLQGSGIGALLMDLVFDKYVEIVSLTTCPFLHLVAKNDELVAYYRDKFGFKAGSGGPDADGRTSMYMSTKAVLQAVADRPRFAPVSEDTPA